MAVIQRLYPSVEQRLKDYVQNPKPNGYQSLHATQLVPDASTNGPPVTIEFQVTLLYYHIKRVRVLSVVVFWCSFFV